MNSQKNTSILLGAVITAILSIINALVTLPNMENMSTLASFTGCLIPVLGTFLTISHYTSSQKLTIKAGEGAGMGAIAMGISAVLSSVLQFVLQAIGVLPSNEALKQKTMAMVEKQWAEQGMTAEQIEQAKGMMSGMDFMSNPIFAVVSAVIMMVIVGAIVGAVAAAIFKKGRNTDV